MPPPRFTGPTCRRSPHRRPCPARRCRCRASCMARACWPAASPSSACWTTPRPPRALSAAASAGADAGIARGRALALGRLYGAGRRADPCRQAAAAAQSPGRAAGQSAPPPRAVAKDAGDRLREIEAAVQSVVSAEKRARQVLDEAYAPLNAGRAAHARAASAVAGHRSRASPRCRNPPSSFSPTCAKARRRSPKPTPRSRLSKTRPRRGGASTRCGSQVGELRRDRRRAAQRL